jgi:aldose 1-epimerase
MEKITLAHHKWLLELMPQTGGSISLCAHDGQDIMRRASPEGMASGDPRDMACFPLVPFSNRIENGVFEFEGQRIELPRNMGDHPHNLHGQGWRAAWELGAQTAKSAVLVYTHEADAWPWRYQATQTFTLTPDSLIVRLGLANLSGKPMPAGLGLHPYFPASEGVTLTAGLTQLWETTNEQIPIRLIDIPEALDFSRGLRIADTNLDHCFVGWDRTALIEWPGRPYRLRMEGDENLNYMVIYTPPEQDHFCVEGVENMNNAFNWMSRGVSTGARILAPEGMPGSTHSVVTVFRVEASPA